MRLLAALACIISFGTVQAQMITGAMFMPSPAGVILSVGQWIYNGTEKIYYIEVMGEGRSPEEARNNGFRLAVEQAVGTIVASESEVNNTRLVRDEIISYASGYIFKYEIIKQDPGGLGVKTTMKVWVKRSPLANRLLGESKAAGEVEGAQASVQLGSALRERADSDRLVVAVLNDFPRRAFVIEAGQTSISMDHNRQAVLTVPVTIKWDKNYLDSVWNSLYETAQNKKGFCNGYDCSNRAMIKGTQGTMFGWRGELGYDDHAKYNLVNDAMINSVPSLLITVINSQNLPVERSCVTWNEFGNFAGILGNNEIYLNGAYVLKSYVPIRINQSQIADATRVDLAVVLENQCPKY